MQNHLLIIDPLERLNLKLDSSLKLGRELEGKGCKVYFCDASDLFWNKSSSVASTMCRSISFKNGMEDLKIGDHTPMLLSQFKSIQMRKEPPVNEHFMAATWLLSAVGEETLVVNSPKTLRDINEKMSIFFEPSASDDALVSANKNEIFDFIKNQCKNVAVVKPLNLFGGRGVFKLDLNSKTESEVLTLLSEETKEGSEFRIIQPFNEKIYDGEVRVFCLNGKAISWCLKRPAEGSYLANTSAGAKLEPYSPSPSLEEKINKVATKLCQEYGAYFLGFDVIGELVSEVNVTSPRLLQSDEDQTNYYDKIAQWLIDFRK